MKMDLVTVIGLLAGICTTGAMVPQVIKTLKTKQTTDISLLMYVFLSAGILLWFVYGLLLKEIPIILANGVSLILAVTVLVLKVRYR